MDVRCESCKTNFDVPLHGDVKIDYERCRNVFRVTYRYRTACPHCRTLLQLTPHGKHAALGVPFAFDADEKTEKVAAPVPTEEATLPRTLLTQAPDEPTPTVRVTKKVPLPSAKPFQFIEQQGYRPQALHVSLKEEGKRRRFPFFKFFLVAVISFSTLLTVGLTFLALRPERKPIQPVLPALPYERPTDEQAARPQLPPQGGPEHDDVAVVEPEELKSEVKPPKPPKAKPAGPSIKLRHLEKVSSTYGMRLDPFNDEPAFHGGVDIAGENRSEVQAALGGTVRFVGKRGGYGNVVILSHGDGYETLYGHLAKSLIKEGSKVKRGELIGLMGSTGRSTGPHLHFELHKDGKKIDPLQLKSLSRKLS